LWHLPERLLDVVEQTDERLQIRETEDSASRGEHDKGSGWGQIRPSSGQGTEPPSGRVMEEHPRFPPRQALREEGKLLAREGMEGMGDREDKLPIRVTLQRHFFQPSVSRRLRWARYAL
jgi:hypothetical protein